MKPINDIWENMGELSDNETFQVLTKLFAIYEAEFQRDPVNVSALDFFSRLDNAIDQTSQCNSNRR